MEPSRCHHLSSFRLKPYGSRRYKVKVISGNASPTSLSVVLAISPRVLRSRRPDGSLSSPCGGLLRRRLLPLVFFRLASMSFRLAVSFSRSQPFFPFPTVRHADFGREGRNLRKAFGQLVLLGSDLAALAPATYLRRSLRRPSWRSYLGGGFVLRCFQHLSWPDADTRRCTWRHNRQTGGLSTTVLSY